MTVDLSCIGEVLLSVEMLVRVRKNIKRMEKGSACSFFLLSKEFSW